MHQGTHLGMHVKYYINNEEQKMKMKKKNVFYEEEYFFTKYIPRHETSTDTH